MIAAAECPCCHEGQLGYRLCANRETVVLLCETCALVWTHPNRLLAEHARDPLHPDFARQHPQIQLRSSRWANPEEITAWGWGAYLLKPSDILQGES
jgi:hypothetical protein